MVKILKKFIPVLCCFVILASFVVPASAADYTLSGVWTLNSNLSMPSLISQDVNFVSGDTSYIRIQVCPEDGRDFESDVLMYCTSTLCTQVYDSSWRYERQTVDFGSTPQTVSSTFYNWITSNATQISSPDTTYFVSIDGSSFRYSSSADSITLDLIITANDYKLSVDGSEEDYLISDTVLNNDRQQFAGLSVNGIVDQVDYGIGRHEIILTPSNSSFVLGTVWKYPLYIDPNGGTWNGSSSVSVFWELPNTDTDDIYDPVRSGYTFNGWTFTGDGEFNSLGEPPYIYEHGTAPGYLTANWVSDSPDPDPSDTFTHTIIIDGSSYVFEGESGAPSVTFDVRDDYVIMISGDQEKLWFYQASGTFLGIRNTATGELYEPAAWFSLAGSSGSNITSTFSVEASDSQPDPDPGTLYSLTINIFNSTGTTLYRTFSVSSLDSPLSPTATMYPIAAGLSVDVGTGARWTWLDAQEGFIGFSDRPYSSTARYAAGGTYYIGGESKDTILNLYVVYQDSPASPVGVDFVSWLGTAVDGFLDFQLWPGLSLNDLLWIILVMGILFAFLKMTV